MNSILKAIVSIVISSFILSCAKQEPKPAPPETAAPQQQADSARQPVVSHPQYDVAIKTSPAVPSALAKVSISIEPSAQAKDAAIELMENTAFNTVVVDNDLTYFNQTEARPDAKGSYAMSLKPPVGGVYTLYAEYTPKGANQVVNRKTFTVEGKPSTTPRETADKWSSTVDNFTIDMKPSVGRFISGVLVMVDGSIKQNGKSVEATRLQEIMGEKSQLYLIGQSTKEFIHLNPEFDEGAFMFHVFFDKPDTYNGWLQFKTGNKVRTAPVLIVVPLGTKEEIAKINDEHSKAHSGVKEPEHKHDHDDHHDDADHHH